MKTDHYFLKIAVLQRNFTVGDPMGNARILADEYAKAVTAGATLVVAPELAISGYPPKDNLLHNAFLQECARAAAWLCTYVEDIPLAFGMPCIAPKLGDYGQKAYNSYVVAQNGRLVFQTDKVYLAQGGVFDEYRVHKPGKPKLWSYMDLNIGFPICEDIWHPKVVRQLAKAGANLFIVPNGSPEYAGKPLVRHRIVRNHVKKWGIPMLYLNHVGGQDEHAFGGGAFYVNPDNPEAVVFAPYWEEASPLVKVETGFAGSRFALPRGAATYPLANNIRFMLDASLMATYDYVRKSSNIQQVVVAVSGGIDSAVVLAKAVKAFGKENVIAISMPTMHNSPTTRGFAQQLCDNLEVKLHWWPIGEDIEALTAKYEEVFGHPLEVPNNTAYENAQSRERGQVAMTAVNREHAMLLSTGNKSEMAMGYATLYGDMNGGYNGLKTFYKTQVYQLAYAINEVWKRDVIPVALITQAPSAELKAGQLDEKSLPAYPVLDAILMRIMADDRPGPADIIRTGLPDMHFHYGDLKLCKFTVVNLPDVGHPFQQWQLVKDTGGERHYFVSPRCIVQVARHFLGVRFKRYQACPGVTVTGGSLDSGEDYPLANKTEWLEYGVAEAIAGLPEYLPPLAA